LRSSAAFQRYALLFLSAVFGFGASDAGVAQNRHAKRINLHSAIERAIAHNPSLRTFEHQLKAQGGVELQATLKASPELNVVVEDALGTGNFKAADSAQATLSISWVLEGETRQGFIDVAHAGTLSLTNEALVLRLDVAAETARLYLTSLARQARLQNARRTSALAKETVQAVKKRVDAGKTPQAELARAQAEAARRLLDYEKRVYELNAAHRLLAAQWGSTHPAFNLVDGNILNLPATLSFKSLRARLEKSPVLMRLLSDKRVKQAALKLAEAQSRANWRLNVGVRHFEATHDQAFVAGLSIPFGERSRNPGGIAQARASLLQMATKKDELRVALQTTLYVLHGQLQHSKNRVGVYREVILPLLEKARSETRKAYNLGRYSYFELRSAQADLLDARNALIDASSDVHLKVIEIERLTGVKMSKSTSVP